MVERQGVSGWWRAATILCLVLLAVALATGMSMMEQFKAQIQHVQGQLKETAQVKYISVLNDDKHAPALLVTVSLKWPVSFSCCTAWATFKPEAWNCTRKGFFTSAHAT